MRGGVNRLIEQRKAAEQAAYDKSIREETEAATIRAEGRQQDKNTANLKAANKIVDQRNLQTSLLGQANDIFTKAFSTTKTIVDDFGTKTTRTDPQISKTKALEGLTSILESIQGSDPAVYALVEPIITGYIGIVSDPTFNSPPPPPVETTSKPDPVGRTSTLAPVQQRVLGRLQSGGIGVGGTAQTIPVVNFSQ